MVNKWIEDNYKDLRDTIVNITKDDAFIDDLLHEVILIFLEKPIAEELVRKKQAKFYFIRIALNQYRSNSSPFHKKYRHNTHRNNRHLINEWWEDLDIEDTNYNIELDELVNLNLDIIEEMLLSDNKEEKFAGFIIMLWFSNGMNYAEVARCLGISRSTYRRQFDDATKIVLEKMKNRDTKITYKQLPLKLYTTELLKGYGKGRRF